MKPKALILSLFAALAACISGGTYRPAPRPFDLAAAQNTCRDIWRTELQRDSVDADCVAQLRAGKSAAAIRAGVRQSPEYVALQERLRAPERHTAEELRNIRANFCNLRDAQDRVIFTSYYSSLPDDERADWRARLVAAGSTHVVLTPGDPDGHDYTGSPIRMMRLLERPEEFGRYVDEVLATRGADGKALTPVVIIDEGGANPRPRIDRYWPAFIDALRPNLGDIIVVPCWECVTASPWTSADLAYAIEKLHALGVPHIWVHLSPGRWAMSSNPIEPDDPWQGDEAGSWKSHGGQYVEGFLYQSEALRDGDDIFCSPDADGCWRNRLADGVVRMGTGYHGWRVMPVAYFEGAAYYYYRGQLSDTHVHDIARAAQEIADRYGVRLGFGNGLPGGQQ